MKTNTLKKAYFALIFSAIFGGIATQVGAQEYQILPQSRIGFIGSKFLAVSVEGSFTRYKGEVAITQGKLETLKGEIEVDSVESSSETRDKNIRGESLLESDKFPTINFVMKSYEALESSAQGEVKGKVLGTLTAHGVSKDVALTSTLTPSKDGYTLRLQGSVNVKKDFKMESWSVMSNTIEIDVLLVLKPAA